MKKGLICMNEQDRRAVEGMARCGIELDGLISAFPKFTASYICVS